MAPFESKTCEYAGLTPADPAPATFVAEPGTGFERQTAPATKVGGRRSVGAGERV